MHRPGLQPEAICTTIPAYSERVSLQLCALPHAGIFFNRIKVLDNQLTKSSRHHWECWGKAEVDPSKVVPEVAHIIRIDNKLTARDREDVVYRHL